MVSPIHLYSVTGLLNSYTYLYFALGGKYCKQLHLKDAENEAQRCNDTCPRPHSQEVVGLGLEPRFAGPACKHPRWGLRAHTIYIPALECGALRERWRCQSLSSLGRGAHLAPQDWMD